MQRFGAFTLLFILTMFLPSAAIAVQCSEIFPQGQTDNSNPGLSATGDTLDLSGKTSGGQPWPPSGGAPLQSGEYVYDGDTLTNYDLELAAGAEVTIFVDGDLTLGTDVKINQAGDANQLLIIVNGAFETTESSNSEKNRIEINAFIYAAESITIDNNNYIEGGLAAGEGISTGNANNFSTPQNWLDEQRLSGLCELPGDGVLPVFDNFESYQPAQSIDGRNGGSNWGGPWEGTAGQSIIDTSDNPLEFVDSEGRRIRSATTLEITGNGSAVASRPLDGIYDGDTVFLSMLVRFTGNPTANDFVGFWTERPGFGNSPQFGLKMNEGGGGVDDFFVRLDQTADYSTNLEPGETYLLVARFSKQGEDFYRNGKLWVNPECDASPPATPSAERDVPPSNRLSEISNVGFRSENLSGDDAFEIGQVAVGTRWTDVVNCSPGPLVEYRMEQTSLDGTPGEVVDTSGNNNDATSQGGLGTGIDDPAIAGNPGTCRYGDFDGDNDQITDNDAGDYLNGLEAVTVMAWVYNSASFSGNDRGIFFTDDTGSGKDNRLGLRYDTSGFFGGADDVIKASVYTDECDPDQECLQVETVSGLMAQNQWQHIAMTWTTDGEIKVYVNGNEVSTSGTQGNGGTGALAGVERLDIGQGAKGQRWQGRIDEFRAFGVALTEAEIMAEMNRAFPCSGFGPNHIRLTHPGQGLTCSSSEVIVEACANQDCTDLFEDPVDVTFTSPADNWVPNPVTFTGQTDVQLNVTEPSTVTLGANAVSPSARNATRCFSGGSETCQMTFLDAGFVIDVPDHVSGSVVKGSIAAVRKDDETERCVPEFSDESKDVSLWSQYSNPSGGSLPVSIDGGAIPTASPGSTRSLEFDGDGVATIDLRYPDVGRVEFNALHEGTGESEGLVMTGVGDFVARPAYFTLDILDNPEATSVSDDNVFAAAGEDFPVTVSSRNIDDDITPNFGNESAPEGVVLNPSLVAPVGGDLPDLEGAFGEFGLGCNGDDDQDGTACGNFNWPEVGIIGVTPTLASGAYLGSENVTGNEVANVGRFVPASFAMQIVDSGAVAPYCSAGNSFAYIGQDLGWSPGSEPLVEVRALATAGSTTRNYTMGSFLRLDSSGVERVAASADETALSTLGAPLSVDTVLDPMARSVASPGVIRFRFSGADSLRYEKEPAAQVAPFNPDYRIAIDRVRDQDNVTSTQPALSLQPGFAFDMRYGRVVLDNAFGPETLPLTIPMRAEYFDGSRFVTNVDESCWMFNLPDDVTLDFSGSALGDGDTEVSPVVDGQMQAGTVVDSDQMVLSAPGEGKSEDPGNRGIKLELAVPVWLQHFWQQGGANDLSDPTALATFGVFRGNDRIIYWREVR